MELKEKSVVELEERKAAIREEIKNPDADLDALETEARAISEELERRVNEEAEKAEERAKVAEDKTLEVIEKIEERTEVKTMDLKEIRNSQEYINAYAEYIKTNDDKECRALLTELVGNTGSVPVPELVYDEVMRAWESDEIMQRVRKSYIKGVVKVGFEASATGAEVHVEGANAPTEETLTLGIVTLSPQSIKKFLTLSDEVMDLTGSAFLEYIYSEIAHRIAQKASDMVLEAIINSPESSTEVAPGVPTLEVEAIGLTTIVEALAQLKGDIRNPVAIMNRSTYAAFRGVQAAASYGMDIFEGLHVIFSDKLENAGIATETFAVVGDLDKVLVNFPNGRNDITFKFDDLSLAEKDLVKIVGRMYAAIGVIAPDAFCKLVGAQE